MNLLDRIRIGILGQPARRDQRGKYAEVCRLKSAVEAKNARMRETQSGLHLHVKAYKMMVRRLADQLSLTDLDRQDYFHAAVREALEEMESNGFRFAARVAWQGRRDSNSRHRG